METTPNIQTAFQRYLASIGDEEAAKKLGVPRRTVQSWRLGDRMPRPKQAQAIIAVLPVTMADIYGAAEVAA